VTPLTTAETVAVPGATAVTTPDVETVATAPLDVVQVACEVTFAVVPSE